jgi:hypothetical protein
LSVLSASALIRNAWSRGRRSLNVFAALKAFFFAKSKSMPPTCVLLLCLLSLCGARIVVVAEGALNTIAFSDDGGATFVGEGNQVLVTNAGNAIFANGTWLAAGSNNALGIVATSATGQGFTSIPVAPVGQLYVNAGISGVAFSPALNMYVLCGFGPSLAWSRDALTWTGLGLNPFMNGCYGVVAGQSKFVAFGAAKPDAIAVSTDGMLWQGVTGSSIFDGAGRRGVYAATLGRWVGVGIGTVHTLAYSADAITWTGLGNAMFGGAGTDVAYSVSQGRFVAVGQGSGNVVAYSSDGIAWTGLGQILFPTSATSGGWGVIFSEQFGSWTVVGDSNLVPDSYATSPDGISWTGRGKAVFTRGRKLASDERAVVVRNGMSLGAGTQTMAGDLLFLASTSLTVPLQSRLVVQGNVTISPNVTLSFSVTQSGTFLLLSAQSVTGTFRDVVAIDSCGGQTPAVLVQTPTDLSATVSLAPSSTSCGGGFPLGAIVGIAVGAAAVGVAVILLIAFLGVRQRKRYDSLANRELRGRDMTSYVRM